MLIHIRCRFNAPKCTRTPIKQHCCRNRSQHNALVSPAYSAIFSFDNNLFDVSFSVHVRVLCILSNWNIYCVTLKLIFDFPCIYRWSLQADKGSETNSDSTKKNKNLDREELAIVADSFTSFHICWRVTSLRQPAQATSDTPNSIFSRSPSTALL